MTSIRSLYTAEAFQMKQSITDILQKYACAIWVSILPQKYWQKLHYYIFWNHICVRNMAMINDKSVGF